MLLAIAGVVWDEFDSAEISGDPEDSGTAKPVDRSEFADALRPRNWYIEALMVYPHCGRPPDTSRSRCRHFSYPETRPQDEGGIRLAVRLIIPHVEAVGERISRLG